MLSRRLACILSLLTIVFCTTTVHADEGKGKMDFFRLFQPTPSVPACELKVKERYEFYDVDGKTVDELRSQMKRNGTRWDDGRTYAALTTWDIKYNYDVDDENGKCSVRGVETSVDIVYHLPRRVASAAAPVELAVAWDRYYAHLKEHEFGHKDLAVKAAGEINETLASLGNFGSRGDLEREARSLIQAKLKRLNELQVQYDQTTHHGATQGAVLSAEMTATR